jgi:hypothetical protein
LTSFVILFDRYKGKPKILPLKKALLRTSAEKNKD